jgi:hypothetical protein
MIDVSPGDLLISRVPWLWRRPTHRDDIAIVVPVFNELVVYEYTMASRPACVRTNRPEPVGVQAHRLSEWVESVKKPAIVALRRHLYYEEIDALLKTTDPPLHSMSLDSFGEGGDANQAHLPVNFVAFVLQQTGIFEAPARRWSARALVRALIRAGIYDFPREID